MYAFNISSLIRNIFINIRMGPLFSIAGGNNGGKADIMIRMYIYKRYIIHILMLYVSEANRPHGMKSH